MLLGNQHVVRRGPINPMDKSTVFSIYPEPIHVDNWTIQPGTFDIAAGTYENPARLVVESSSWWKVIDDDHPPIEVTVGSVLVADSIVNDWSNGLLGCNMDNNRPGFFWMPGVISVEQLKKEHKAILDKAKKQQDNWFNHLVRMGDIFWARTNGNPLGISDQMRLAAKSLNLTSKEWISQNASFEMVSCPACQTFIKSAVIVCPNCHVVVKPEEFKKLNLSFAS